METLKAFLNLSEARYEGKSLSFNETDPSTAMDLLHVELSRLEDLTYNIFFGSAADVAGRRAKKQMAEAINKVRAKVKMMHTDLEGDMKRLNNEIDEILSEYR